MSSCVETIVGATLHTRESREADFSFWRLSNDSVGSSNSVAIMSSRITQLRRELDRLESSYIAIVDPTMCLPVHAFHTFSD